MNKEMAVELGKNLEKLAGDWKRDLAGMGVPVIEGSLQGHGHTLVKVAKWQDEIKRFRLGDEPIAVLHIAYSDETREIIETLDLSIKLGSGNIWLNNHLVNVFVDMDDDDIDDEELYGYYQKTPEEEAAVNATAMLVAKEAVFGGFKNRDQRKDFIVSFVKKNGIANLPRDYDRDIAYLAEMIHEYGLLPSQAQALQAQGMTINDIAKKLGITKSKAQKVVAREIPENILALMSADGSNNRVN